MTIVFKDQQFLKPSGTYRQGYYLHDKLHYYLDNYFIKGVDYHHDAIAVITGLEGTGKSTFVQAIAHYCGASRGQPLKLDNIVFTGKDLMNSIDNAAPYTPIIFDEAIMNMGSQDFGTDIQKILIKKFTLIRKKRLFIFIVIPSFFMLRKYFAIFRTKIMLNCVCPDGIQRGYFRFYSHKKKKQLWHRGIKEMDMSGVVPDFTGRFTNTYGYFVDSKEYEAKKDEATKTLTGEEKDEKEKLKEQFEDIKLKYKIQNEQYRSKLKEKYEEKFGTLQQKYKDRDIQHKNKFEQELDKIKETDVTMKKARITKDFQKYSKQYYKTISFFYKSEKERILKQSGQELKHTTFLDLLKENNVLSLSSRQLLEDIKKGNELIALKV
jgi:hypothetical protein